MAIRAVLPLDIGLPFKAEASLESQEKNLMQLFIQTLISPVAKFTPELAFFLSEPLVMVPPRYTMTCLEKAYLETGHYFTIRHGNTRLAAWSWGDGPTIYLLHGWGGRGAQFIRFVPELLQAGYSVVLLDAPAHGSSGGQKATVRDFAGALSSAVESCGPAHGVVGHSLGAAAAVLAIRQGLKVKRAVFVAPPECPAPYLNQLMHKLKLEDAMLSRFQECITHRVGTRREDVSLAQQGSDLSATWLMISDTDDEEVPLTTVERIAKIWPAVEWMKTSGWGHRKILRAPEVIRRTAAFMGEGG